MFSMEVTVTFVRKAWKRWNHHHQNPSNETKEDTKIKFKCTALPVIPVGSVKSNRKHFWFWGHGSDKLAYMWLLLTLLIAHVYPSSLHAGLELSEALPD